MSVTYETTGDALREVHRRITARIEEHRAIGGGARRAAMISGFRVSARMVEEVLTEVIEAPPPEPIEALPLREDLCHMCGLPYRPAEYLDGHAECREQE